MKRQKLEPSEQGLLDRSDDVLHHVRHFLDVCSLTRLQRTSHFHRDDAKQDVEKLVEEIKTHTQLLVQANCSDWKSKGLDVQREVDFDEIVTLFELADVYLPDKDLDWFETIFAAFYLKNPTADRPYAFVAWRIAADVLETPDYFFADYIEDPTRRILKDTDQDGTLHVACCFPDQENGFETFAQISEIHLKLAFGDELVDCYK